MKKCIADALGLRECQIGIKATTNEHMGFIGREEGIAAMAAGQFGPAVLTHMPKAEISWKRVTQDGAKLQVNAQRVGGELAVLPPREAF